MSVTPGDVLSPGGILDTLEHMRQSGLCEHLGLTGIGSPQALAEVLASGAFTTLQTPVSLVVPYANCRKSPITPGAAPQRGAKDFDAAFLRMRSAPKTHEVLEYRMEFEEVKVFGNYAIEWGAIRGATRDLATGRVTQSEYHLMRVLRRQSNGRWKVYRSIWAPGGGTGST